MTVKSALFALLVMYFLAMPTMALEVTRVEPEPDSELQETEPIIRIYVAPAKGEIIDPNKISILLNGKKIANRCLVIQNGITCVPDDRFPQGKNTLQFIYAGTPQREFSWSFTVRNVSDPKGELTHNATNGALQEGEILEVELKSKPGGSARFDIGNWKEDMAMREESPGVYKGSYKVERMNSAKDQIVSASLRLPGGETLHFESPRRVTISAYFFKVKILSPANDSEVANYFDIIGRTRPGSRVSLAPQLHFTGGIGANPGGMGAIEVMADEKGNFKIHYGMPIKIPGMQLNFMVTARDTEGNISLPVSFSVKIK